MKKTAVILLLLMTFVFSASAQMLCIDSSGEAIPERYGSRIRNTLLKEVDFYGLLGLPDTVRVKLAVFRDTDSGNAFLRQYDPEAYGNYCGGMFIPQIETAVIATTEDMDRAVRTLFHEISHFLYHKAMDSAPNSATYTAHSLNEGLACYFGFMNIRKDGTVFQRPEMSYINDVKTLVEIDDFNLTEYLRMNHDRFTARSRHDGNISYHVSYVIVATLFGTLETEGMRNLLAMVRDGITYEEAVETLYPGGKAALEDDVRRFVLKK